MPALRCFEIEVRREFGLLLLILSLALDVRATSLSSVEREKGKCVQAEETTLTNEKGRERMRVVDELVRSRTKLSGEGRERRAAEKHCRVRARKQPMV